MNARRLGGLLSAGLAALGVVAAVSPGVPDSLRVVLGVPALLFAPGYALVESLWPRIEMPGAVRAVFVAASSIALLVLLALLVAALPVGLTPASVSVTVLVSTLLLLGWAEFDQQRASVPAEPTERARHWRSRDVLGITIAVIVAVTSVVVARHAAHDSARRTAFTQLYVNPGRTPSAVIIGVRSFEKAPTRFRLVVRGAQSVRPLRTLGPFRLAPGSTFQKTFGLPRSDSIASLKVTLYRSTSQRPYRTVG